MTYKGHVRNGVIVLDDSVDLAEGTEVRIEVPAGMTNATAEKEVPTLATRLAAVIGQAGTLPADWSANHDTYLREHHRR